MTKPFHVVIVGAGPAGLATALALSKQPPVPSSPLRITILELRSGVQSLGGAVNLTPLALRYLDWLGAGEKLRPQSAKVSAIELVGHRTGGLLGRLWPDVDAVRTQRQVLVTALRDAIYELPQEQQALAAVKIIYGAKISHIQEHGDVSNGHISLTYTVTTTTTTSSSSRDEETTLEADIVIGCDGIHSLVRTTLVDPARPRTYSGKCSTYGYVDLRKDSTNDDSSERVKSWLRSDGAPFVTDTTLVSKANEALLVTYYEPSREKLYLACVSPMAERKDAAREGWTAHGADKAGLKASIGAMFEGGALPFLRDVIDLCDEWFFFPVYMLPPEGKWHKGRAVIIGDAAHAMPPQGEGTGIAIEDGVLLARVLSRRTTRSIPTLFDDYEALRRPDIRDSYKETMSRWKTTVPDGWLSNVSMDWMTWVFLKLMGLRSDYFGRDVRNRELPD